MKFKKQVDMKVVLLRNTEPDWSGLRKTGSLYTLARKRPKSLVENWSMPKNGASTRINGRKMVDDVIYTSQF